MTNERIEEILNKAKEAKACSSNYNVAKKAFDNNDIQLCLETFLGNIVWLTNCNICSIEEIPTNIIKGKRWWNNVQLQYEGTFINGVLNGKFIEYFENGQICIERTYINGKSDGEITAWYNNGYPYYQYTSRNGTFDGKYQEWYENGQLVFECFYINGILDGKVKHWSENGDLVYEHTYSNGVIIK